MNYFVYIAKCRTGTLYTGITTDLERRILQHNGELKGGSIYTSARRPVQLVYSEACASRSEALKRECDIKKLPRNKKLLLIQ